MSTFTIKLIAIIAMLIDHLGAIFISPSTNPELYALTRVIGRLAFPIFVFLIVEGFFHTRDVRSYLKRLGIFALISEIPFDLAFYHLRFQSNVLDDIKNVFVNYQEEKLLTLIERFNKNQNVFFTLFLGLLLIYLMSLVEKQFQKQLLISNLIDAVLTISILGLSYFLKTDYDIAGILLFVSFYLFRGSKAMLSFCLFIISATILCNFERISYFMMTGNYLYIISMFTPFAMVPIAFYNGKKGKSVKYLFYIFYPGHLLLLYLLNQII